MKAGKAKAKMAWQAKMAGVVKSAIGISISNILQMSARTRLDAALSASLRRRCAWHRHMAAAATLPLFLSSHLTHLSFSFASLLAAAHTRRTAPPHPQE